MAIDREKWLPPEPIQRRDVCNDGTEMDGGPETTTYQQGLLIRYEVALQAAEDARDRFEEKLTQFDLAGFPDVATVLDAKERADVAEDQARRYLEACEQGNAHRKRAEERADIRMMLVKLMHETITREGHDHGDDPDYWHRCANAALERERADRRALAGRIRALPTHGGVIWLRSEAARLAEEPAPAEPRCTNGHVPSPDGPGCVCGHFSGTKWPAEPRPGSGAPTCVCGHDDDHYDGGGPCMAPGCGCGRWMVAERAAPGSGGAEDYANQDDRNMAGLAAEVARLRAALLEAADALEAARGLMVPWSPGKGVQFREARDRARAAAGEDGKGAEAQLSAPERECVPRGRVPDDATGGEGAPQPPVAPPPGEPGGVEPSGPLLFLAVDGKSYISTAWLEPHIHLVYGDIVRAAVAEEREACARLADDVKPSDVASYIVAKIRARAQGAPGRE